MEIVKVAEINWKGITWRAAYGDLSIKELLTILKGFGAMEMIEFEVPGKCRGQMSLSLTKEGLKEITLYYLEIFGSKRKGKGRATLKMLKDIFKGELYVEDPGLIRVKNVRTESLFFWVKMFREGLIDAMDSTTCSLWPRMTEDDIARVEEAIRLCSASNRLRRAE